MKTNETITRTQYEQIPQAIRDQVGKTAISAVQAKAIRDDLTNFLGNLNGLGGLVAEGRTIVQIYRGVIQVYDDCGGQPFEYGWVGLNGRDLWAQLFTRIYNWKEGQMS